MKALLLITCCLAVLTMGCAGGKVAGVKVPSVDDVNLGDGKVMGYDLDTIIDLVKDRFLGRVSADQQDVATQILSMLMKEFDSSESLIKKLLGLGQGGQALEEAVADMQQTVNHITCYQQCVEGDTNGE